ncbi:FliH/SctL family protein [Mobilicoccus pelagius]|uniref:Flagellar assembly protein FliH n=1 Tax=Mobilicoccus pelagius NBRC 104925 TaxID=1089455 RepID=H5UP72_9MICO|nr:FliH/SctL family protein [Mobilicoccus pelagius]GAB47530.1 flagellar assembly protein FliH [Mobilicoccus pelagius NBRC 104925]
MPEGLRYTPNRTSYVIRAAEDDTSRPARMGADLTATEYAPVGVADPRLVDPYLAEVVEKAKEQAHAQGYEDGRAQGFEAGRREGLDLMAQQQAEIAERDARERASRKERLGELLANVENAIAGALNYQAPAVTELQEVVTELAVQIAESLVGHHLEVGECTARDAVMRALSQVPRRATVTLRMNPADHDDVTAITGDIMEWTVADVVADPTVARGDAIAMATNLEVDASLEGALDRVRTALNA